jgi:putative FmdB family regulatory protein|tara:strand:+ start:368 stop:634 length:267 start_codon:yes stop_codon:yes gene_type:complete
MPSYDLQCPECTHEWEDFSTVAERELIRCPNCLDSRGLFSYGVIQITCKSDPSIWCVGDTAYNESAGITYTGPQDLKNKVKAAGLQER